MLKTFTLKNGLRVATYSIPEMKAIYLSLSVKSGSIFDSEKTSGVAHFMEHILVQAIPSFPTVEFLTDFIEGLAGSYSATTYSESINFRASFPSNHLGDMLKIAGEIFFQPLFKESDIEKEREAVLQEIKQRQDTTWYKNNKFWSKIRFKSGHPLLLDGGGSVEVVSKLQKKDLVNFWSRFFHPHNAYLVLVGDFESKELESLVENNFNKINSKLRFSGFPKFTNKQLSSKTVSIREDTQLKTCYIDLSFPSLNTNDPIYDKVTQSIICYILGGLRRSRLFRLLRQQKGLVYDVGFTATNFQYFGYINTYSQAALENVAEVIFLITQELSAFRKSGPSSEELEFAKNYYINRIMMSFDNPGSIAGWLETDLLWNDKMYTLEAYCEIIKKVNLKSVMEIIKKYWDFNKVNLTIQGPIQDSKENLEKYEKILEVL